MLVFMDERELTGRCRRRCFGHAHGGHTNLVTLNQPGVGPRAATVDTHLARADDAVHVRLRHALQLAQQEVVQPLAGAALVDRDVAHVRRGR
jgi:hypothetical protein